MGGATIQHLFLSHVLAAFVLAQSLFATMGVRCRDAHGEVRFELVCVKADDGACESIGAGVSQRRDDCGGLSGHTPTPCEDEPLGKPGAVFRTPPRSLSPSFDFAAAWIPAPGFTWTAPEAEFAETPRFMGDHARPPDSLARLRTVILLI